MRIRWSLRFLLLTVAAVAIAAALISTAWRATSNRVVIENRSGLVIVSLSVTVGGRSIGFPRVAQGGTVESRYPIRGDDHFVLAGKLSDGTQFGGDFGYVTNGMYGEVAYFIIEPGGNVVFGQGGSRLSSR